MSSCGRCLRGIDGLKVYTKDTLRNGPIRWLGLSAHPAGVVVVIKSWKYANQSSYIVILIRWETRLEHHREMREELAELTVFGLARGPIIKTCIVGMQFVPDVLHSPSSCKI
jgi:hypothetical protein